LLIVDDEPDVRSLLVRCLTQRGHICTEAEGGRQALVLMKNGSFDAVLLDIRMPSMSGIELLVEIKSLNEEVAVVMITAIQDLQDAVMAMKLGADDYIIKPFNFEDVCRGLDRGLEKMELKRQIREYQTNLESMVARRTKQVQHLFMNVIQSLIYTLEAKDPYTNGHSVRVTWLSKELGRAAGCGTNELELLQLGGMLHDLGKIGIQEEVLRKTGSLSGDEYDQIKKHPDIGVRILQPFIELKDILPIVRHHHEHYDGRGYPLGLRAEEIPLLARIVSIADAYDAMTSVRPYRNALPAAEAILRLRAGAGTQFDSRLVGLFISLTQDGEFIKKLYCHQLTSAGTSIEDSNLAAISLMSRQ
jgi:putative nucleotidyltransferase with HDIG domain